MELKKYIICWLILGICLSSKAAWPMLDGTNVYSGINTDTNRWTVNGNFISITNSSVLIPTNNIIISGSTNNFVNGTYTLSSATTNGLGLVSYSWINSTSTTNITTNVPITAIILDGQPPSYFQQAYPQYQAEPPISGVFNAGWWGYHNPPVTSNSYYYGGTNYIIYSAYQSPGSLAITFNYRTTTWPYYTQIGWDLWNVGVVAYNTTQIPIDSAWTNGWTFPDIDGLPNSFGPFTSRYVLGNTTIITNVDLFTIVSSPTFYPPTTTLTLSDGVTTYTKDPDTSDPNGHWTQIVGTGDSAISGTAVTNSDNVSSVYSLLYVPNVACQTFTLNGITYTNLNQIISQIVNTTVSVNGNGGTNSGLSVTNWTLSTNFHNITLTTNVVYTNNDPAGILHGVIFLTGTNTGCFVHYTINGNTEGSSEEYSSSMYSASLSNQVSFPFTIGLNAGSTIQFTPFIGSQGIININATDFLILPH